MSGQNNAFSEDGGVVVHADLKPVLGQKMCGLLQGVIVVHDTTEDKYRITSYDHCSYNGTFDQFSDDTTKILCDGASIEKKIYDGLDPLFEVDREMSWCGCDAEQIAILLIHFARDNKELRAFIQIKQVSL